MLAMVNHLDIALAERHRAGLRQIAARCHGAAPRGAADSATRLSRAERHHLLVSLAGMWPATAATEVEFADPLGVWSCGYPRQRSRWWPERRALLDWSAWAGLCLAAIAYGTFR